MFIISWYSAITTDQIKHEQNDRGAHFRKYELAESLLFVMMRTKDACWPDEQNRKRKRNVIKANSDFVNQAWSSTNKWREIAILLLKGALYEMGGT